MNSRSLLNWNSSKAATAVRSVKKCRNGQVKATWLPFSGSHKNVEIMPLLFQILATPLDPSMPQPTNINKKNAAINHGKIVSIKSLNEYPRSAKKLIDLLLSIGNHSSCSWLEYPDVLEAVFCFYCLVFNATVSRLI